LSMAPVNRAAAQASTHQTHSFARFRYRCFSSRWKCSICRRSSGQHSFTSARFR
jgi:hypothetical protein